MNIAIIGYGKVGSQLCRRLLKQDAARSIYVWNRSKIEEKNHPGDSVTMVEQIGDLPHSIDICFLTVRDDAIAEVALQLPVSLLEQAIVAHTSGIHSRKIFPDSVKQPAVFYPLNTFSDQYPVEWESTPVYVIAEDAYRSPLLRLAKKLKVNIYEIDDRQKEILHLAAVMVNNFTNGLFQMAEEILQEHELDFHPLLPLIETTFQKIEKVSPKKAQTGPAVRGDMATLRRHLQLLEGNENAREIYRRLSMVINKNLKDENL